MSVHDTADARERGLSLVSCATPQIEPTSTWRFYRGHVQTGCRQVVNNSPFATPASPGDLVSEDAPS